MLGAVNAASCSAVHKAVGTSFVGSYTLKYPITKEIANDPIPIPNALTAFRYDRLVSLTCLLLSKSTLVFYVVAIDNGLYDWPAVTATFLAFDWNFWLAG